MTTSLSGASTATLRLVGGWLVVARLCLIAVGGIGNSQATSTRRHRRRSGRPTESQQRTKRRSEGRTDESTNIIDQRDAASPSRLNNLRSSDATTVNAKSHRYHRRHQQQQSNPTTPAAAAVVVVVVFTGVPSPFAPHAPEVCLKTSYRNADPIPLGVPITPPVVIVTSNRMLPLRVSEYFIRDIGYYE